LAGAQCVKTTPWSHCVLLSGDSSHEALAGTGNARRAITSVATAHLAVAIALHQALAQAVAGQHAAQPLPLVLLVAAPERRRAREEGRRPVHVSHRLGRAAGQAARDGARQLQWHGGLARRACAGHFRFERQQARQASAPLSAHAQVRLAHRQLSQAVGNTTVSIIPYCSVMLSRDTIIYLCDSTRHWSALCSKTALSSHRCYSRLAGQPQPQPAASYAHTPRHARSWLRPRSSVDSARPRSRSGQVPVRAHGPPGWPCPFKQCVGPLRALRLSCETHLGPVHSSH